MKRRIAALGCLIVAALMLIKPTVNAVQYLIIDYGMHHQTGILCFDYEVKRHIVLDGTMAKIESNETGVDNVEDYWRTAVDTDGEATIMGYGGWQSI